MGDVQGWNSTDDSNTDLFPENMAFSEVNDGGRAVQGAVARWFQDTNGSIAASGSSNAFAVTSKRTISALANNIVMAFTANHTITGAATLDLNGLGAKSIKRFNGDDLTAGDIVSGQPVWVIYKSADDVWYMVSAAAALFANMHADFNENATPGDPSANTARLYAEDDGSGTTVLAYRDSAGTESVIGGVASKAEMEAASSLIKSSSPGRQHFHPGHPKAIAYGAAAGGTLSGATNYNVSSIVRNSTGRYTVTLATAMSSAAYGVNITVSQTSGSAFLLVSYDITSSSVFTVTIETVGGNSDDADFTATVFGDQ